MFSQKICYLGVVVLFCSLSLFVIIFDLVNVRNRHHVSATTTPNNLVKQVDSSCYT